MGSKAARLPQRYRLQRTWLGRAGPRGFKSCASTAAVETTAGLAGQDWAPWVQKLRVYRSGLDYSGPGWAGLGPMGSKAARLPQRYRLQRARLGRAGPHGLKSCASIAAV
eukprot:gene9142-biopygen950